ncbi:type I site-specific deoxyribonuclease [Nostoc commune NIES-4072]|uniref:Type I site-specific deoxyribonuclease n=1 Tax=Nostoc commune NIES-4072 TaxID=2005467 RepID=A0A2R5FVD0_NOSCO|nr:restriction endonuclease subunit S [Nostoc commune]BBD70042.1 type I site-specific deoxyribonuclease [Nostoc commune HK-02]GBG22710.1 type I site-specific deoxyribonuclease [Nostoc commune NIES-4072]
MDEAIARTSSLIIKLKQTKAGLLQDLLTRGLDEDGKLRDPQAHPEKFQDSPLGQIPKEWEVATIGEACSLVKDGSHLPPKRVENGPLLLSVQNMINGGFQLTEGDTRISWDFYKTMHKNWQIQIGDVLLAIVGATIGKTAVVRPMPPFTLQRSVAVLRGKIDTLENSFLHLYISSEKFQRLIWRKVNQTAQPGLYLAELASFYIPLPSLKEQKNITAVIESQNTRLRTEEAYLNKLKLQKQGLMQDLLTGKVQVRKIK